MKNIRQEKSVQFKLYAFLWKISKKGEVTAECIPAESVHIRNELIFGGKKSPAEIRKASSPECITSDRMTAVLCP